VTRRRLTGAARVLERRRENVEILMGALGFFILVILFGTVHAELNGETSVARSVVLIILLGLFYALIRLRRILQHRLDAFLRETDAAGRSRR
jgi:hypothetical protein